MTLYEELMKSQKKDFLFWGVDFKLVPKILIFYSLLTIDLGWTEHFSFSSSFLSLSLLFVCFFLSFFPLKMLSQVLTVSKLFLEQREIFGKESMTSFQGGFN